MTETAAETSAVRPSAWHARSCSIAHVALQQPTRRVPPRRGRAANLVVGRQHHVAMLSQKRVELVLCSWPAAEPPQTRIRNRLGRKDQRPIRPLLEDHVLAVAITGKRDVGHLGLPHQS